MQQTASFLAWLAKLIQAFKRAGKDKYSNLIDHLYNYHFKTISFYKQGKQQTGTVLNV
jgi:hypothetical protein